MPSGKKITEADRLTILRLNAAGRTFDAIASETSICRQTVSRVVRDAARRYFEFWRQTEWFDDMADREQS